MVYEKLGKTDIDITKIVFGCWELGGGPWEFTSDQSNFKTLRYAFDHGITTFDTAEGYGDGHSEQVVGKALTGIRNKCVIATKVAPDHLHAKDVRKSIEKSLKNLNTDYVDIYYIHWPNNEIPIEETMDELNKLKKEGLIRAIGVSNFSLEQLKKAMELGRVDAVQPEYSLLQRNIESGLLQYCVENSISVLSYSSIAKGILTGVFHFGKAQIKEGDFRLTRRLFKDDHLEKERVLIELMKEIADAKDVELSQIALSWLFHQKGLTAAIVGTQSEKHFNENIQAVTIKLTPDEVNRLSETSSKVLKSIDG